MRAWCWSQLARSGGVAKAGLVFAALCTGVTLCMPTAPASAITRANPIPPPTSGCYVGGYLGATDATGLAAFDEQAGKPHAFFLKFIDVNGGDPSDSWSSVEQFCQSCYAVAPCRA